ncbi:MAG: UDP-N-acetylmuramate--L-alanine ligase [Candidatus Lambdaproteobacteria bacterium]|nr:UDP-N-acetylmuramate--L-alanine ligase [Candidatus Lambdaproteobacteria bacterium]
MARPPPVPAPPVPPRYVVPPLTADAVLNPAWHYHFLGIGGVGMSALAEVLHRRGHRISGSDAQPSELLRHLARLGIPVRVGHDPAALEGVDAVVYTPAVAPGHPIWAAVAQRGLPRIHRAELLGALTRRARTAAVCGTHGKTTSSAALTLALVAAGWEPTALVGGQVPELGGRNNRCGDGPWLVAEADESDASFIALSPEAILLTNIEPEHLDHHGSVERMRQAFAAFLARLPAGGLLVHCADDPAAREVGRGYAGRRLCYGAGAGADVRVQVQRMAPGAMEIRIAGSGAPVALTTRLGGRHNALNLAGVFALAEGLGVPRPPLVRALEAFGGVARRQQYLGAAHGLRIFDDYAHHPTEIRATLAMFLELYGEPLTVVFQPHLYSRTATFAEAFAEALRPATRVYVAEVYGAREAPVPGVSGRMIVERLAGHPAARFLPDWHELPARVRSGEVPPGILLTLGAGDITALGPLLLGGGPP